MAAHFDPSIPGRAAVRTGPGRIQTFQTGYLGGRTSSRPSPPRIGVASLQFGPSDEWDVPPPALPADAQDAEGPTDIAAAVDVIGSAAELAGLPEPRKPWLPELDQHFDLAELWDTVGHEDTGWLLGMMDDPGEQSRRAVFYSPSGHGNLAIYGSVGAGKSQALRTLVLSAAQNWQTDPTEVYVIDAGSGAMAAVSPLPAVGDVIDSTDDERILRLMRQLTEQLDQRVSMFAQVNASSLEEYRSNSGQLDFPRVLLVLDGFSAFRDRFETDRSLAPGYAALARVLAEGRSVGIHVVMSAERPGSLPTALVPTISRKLILRQADPNSYLQLQIPKDVLSAASAPGRSVFAEDTREVQIAMLGQPASGAAQAAAIAELAEALAAEGAPSATGIRRLASMLAVEELPAQVNGKPVLGIESGTLEPFGFDPSGMLIVAGLPGSGRTSTVLALSTALRRFSQTMELYYVGPRTSPVGKLDMWDGIANDPTTAVELFAQIKGRFEIPAEPGEEAGLVIESIGDLFGPPADVKAQELFKLAKRNGHLVIAEGEQSVWNASWGLMQELRSQRRGILLQPDSADGEVLFRTPFPRGKRSDYPLGRGVWVESGKCKVVQLPFVGGPADGMALLAAQALGNDG
jgi:S-DNA-T family DNA segregation ATPase FtsK/SpoIIIE